MAVEAGADRPLGHFEPLEARQLLAVVEFGNLNTTGDGDTGWTTSGDTTNDPYFAGDGPAQYVGTSDGDVLAAGDYTIDFIHAAVFGNPANFTVEAFAWNGSAETSLGPATTVT